MTPQQAVAQLVNFDAIDNSALKPFDESGIWDPGMDPFPPSRAEAVRLARERGEGLGEKMLPAGIAAPAPAGRRQVLLQPVLPTASRRSASACGGRTGCSRPAPARGEADAVLARALRDRREQGARLPDDAAAERDAPRAARRARLRGSARRDPQGSGDARLSRQRREHQVAPERELRPRAARAVLDGRRQLHRARRPRGGARLHRLDQRRPRVQVRRRAARLRREDVPRPNGPVQRRRHHRHHPRAAGDRPSSWRRSSIATSCARRSSPRGEDRARPRRSATAAIRSSRC